MTWLIPEIRLSAEQKAAIHLPHDTNQLIIGPAGSGKTQILLHRAKYLANVLGTTSDKYRIMVYTKTLKEYIRSALDWLNLPDESVTNVDAWCYDFHRQYIRGSIPWDKEKRRPDFDGIRSNVLAAVKTDRSRQGMFDFVLVDEGQDLDEVSYEILRKIAKHITVCADNRQQIFETGLSSEAIARKLGTGRNLTILKSYRCSPLVVSVAAAFIDDPGERASFINGAKAVAAARTTPTLYTASDEEDEKNRLIEVAKNRLAAGDRIGVLFPKRAQVFGFATGFREAGIEVETQKDDQNTLDFNSNRIKVVTYESAKGLTFDTVLLPRLVSGSFSSSRRGTLENRLFVAITRAYQWVYMSTISGKEIPALNRLSGLGRSIFTMQGQEVSSPATQRKSTLSEDDLLL